MSLIFSKISQNKLLNQMRYQFSKSLKNRLLLTHKKLKRLSLKLNHWNLFKNKNQKVVTKKNKKKMKKKNKKKLLKRKKLKFN